MTIQKKITILTTKAVAEVFKNKVLADSNIDPNNIEIIEQKREPLYKVKLRARIWILKDNIKTKIQDIKSLIRQGWIEPRFGGAGGFDYETLYGFVANLFTIIILPGIEWDLIKTILKKSYHFLKRQKDYIVITSVVRRPGDTLIRMRIPTDLDEEDLNWCLESGVEVYKHIDEIRGHFGFFKIILTYTNHHWKIDFKHKLRYLK